MDSLMAQAALSLGVAAVIIFVLGVLVGIFFRPESVLLPPDPPPGAFERELQALYADLGERPAADRAPLLSVGTRRVRAGPLRDAVDDACSWPRQR